MTNIETVGDRIDNGFCVLCGTTLMHPYNDFRTCTNCTKLIRKAQHDAMNSKTIRKESRSAVIINRRVHDIKLQTRPIGVEADK